MYLWFVLSFFPPCVFQSGARINISDGACQERIVTITGSPESIHTAFTLITKKLEEVRMCVHTVWATILQICKELHAGYRALPAGIRLRVIPAHTRFQNVRAQ